MKSRKVKSLTHLFFCTYVIFVKGLSILRQMHWPHKGITLHQALLSVCSEWDSYRFSSLESSSFTFSMLLQPTHWQNKGNFCNVFRALWKASTVMLLKDRRDLGGLPSEGGPHCFGLTSVSLLFPLNLYVSFSHHKIGITVLPYLIGSFEAYFVHEVYWTGK